MAKDTELKELVDDIVKGNIILPDFQRDFTWKLNDIRSLIASIFLEYPIGSVLTVQKDSSLFAHKSVMGLSIKESKSTVKYLLDGQQRLTSCYLVFSDSYKCKDVRDDIRRRWFLDLNKLGLECDDKELIDFVRKHILVEGEDLNELLESIYNIEDDKELSDLIRKRSSNLNECSIQILVETIEDMLESKNIFRFPKEKDLIEILESENEAIVNIKVDLRKTTKSLNKNSNDPGFRDYCLENSYYPLNYEILKGEFNYILIQNIADRALDSKCTKYNINRDKSKIYNDLESKKYDWVNKVQNFLNKIQKYKLPEIDIEKDATLEKIARVFETVNKTGMTLTLFELLVARATCPNSKGLKEIINEVKDRIKNEYIPESIYGNGRCQFNLGKFISNKSKEFYEWYPKVLSVIVQLEEETRDSVEISKQAILSTKREWLNMYSEEAAKRLYRAYIFLNCRCGVYYLDKIPYKQMLIPIAYVLKDDIWYDKSKINKVEAWYWSAIFTSRYTESQDRMCKEDIFKLRDFILDNDYKKPDYITNINNMIIEFKTYTGIIDKNKGIYKAFMQYVLSKRPYDLSPNKNKLDSYKIMDENIKIEDHHIIPKSWIKNNIKLQNENIIDSCLNRVYISEEANRGREDGIFAQNTGKYLENIPDDSIKSLFIPEILKESCTMDENQYIEYIKSRYKLVKHEIQSEIIDLI